MERDKQSGGFLVMNILVVNAGSSSIKSVLFTAQNGSFERIIDCTASNISEQRASIDVTLNGESTCYPTSLPDHATALAAILETIQQHASLDDIDSVGYRVVYGGSTYYKPTVINDEVQADLASFNDIDPEHAPLSLAIITQLRADLPHAQHIACFDTAFFHDLPAVAHTVAIPREHRDAGIRRFGYHGLSYQYVSDKFGQLAGDAARRGRVIYAHLGSGASVAATLNGLPVDTTMGVTPTSGLVMGTRSGDVDPSLPWMLSRSADMSIDEYQHMINHQSGLLAVSELSSDMYTLLQHQSTNPSAALAVELFCYQVKKAIGSLSATIGGIDSLVFCGGMAEQSAEIRRRICEGLEYLGVVLSPDANERRDRLISAPESQVGVHVIPTDEALAIATNIVSISTNAKDSH